MNQLRRLAGIFALSFSASAIAADAPQAYADPATMSTDEKQTLALTVNWRDCTARKAKELDAKAAEISALRSAAAADVTRKALTDIGWTPHDAQRMVDALKDRDERSLSFVLTAKTDIDGACFSELKISQEDLITRLGNVRNKYGPDIDSGESVKRLLPELKLHQ